MSESNWIMGTVTAVDGEKAFVQPDSECAALKKACKVPRGSAARAGDRTLLLQYGGAYLAVAVYAP